MKWIGRPPKLTAEQIARVQEVYRLRSEIPSLGRLAREFGVNESTLRNYATKMPKRYGLMQSSEG